MNQNKLNKFAAYIYSLIVKAYNLTVYTRVYIAIGSAFVVYALSYLEAFSYSPLLAASAFGAVFAVYAMNRKSDLDEDEENLEYGGKELAEKTYKLGLISLLASISIAFIVDLYVLGAILAFILLLSAYSFKFLPASFKYRRLKEIPLVKNIVTSVALALVFVIGSLLNFSSSALILVVGMFIFLVIRVFIGAVIPDIRDIEGDKSAGISTVPVILGVKNTKKLLYLVNLAAIILYFGMIEATILPSEAYLAGSVNFLAFPVIYKTKMENADTMTLITEFNTLFTFSILLILGWLI